MDDTVIYPRDALIYSARPVWGMDAPTRTTTQVVDSRRPPRIDFVV